MTKVAVSKEIVTVHIWAWPWENGMQKYATLNFYPQRLSKELENLDPKSHL